ncbi:MAG: class I SAM-dependent methyltransferase [Chloroflexota bacterium]
MLKILNELYTRIDRWAFDAVTDYRACRIVNILREALKDGDTILDCGCGSMYIPQLLENRAGVRAFGTDIIKLNQVHPRFCICNGANLSFSDGSFDSVFLAFVLHHTVDQEQTIQECLRVARRRVIILEDVFYNRLELELLKRLDVLGNHVISNDMPYPFTFQTPSGWRTLFAGLNARVTVEKGIRPIPWRPSRHRMFVLEKDV